MSVFGLRHAPPAISGTLSVERIAAIATAVAVTSAAMVMLRVSHPPAAATALIVSLGLLTSVVHALAFLLGVVALVLQGFVLDRLSGLRYPAWSNRSDEKR